jgi:hypothetical protein
MANPEIKLPPDPADEENDIANPDNEKEEQESKPHADSVSSLAGDEVVNDSDPITWHYLTHDTNVPPPAYLSQSPALTISRSQPTECPDLKKYGSPFSWPQSRKRLLVWSVSHTSCDPVAATDNA